MSVDINPFCPQGLITMAVGAGSSAAAVAITQNTTTQNSSPLYNFRIYNDSNGIAFVQFGGTGVIATSTTGYPVGSGKEAIIRIPTISQGVAAILGTGTGNVYVSPG